MQRGHCSVILPVATAVRGSPKVTVTAKLGVTVAAKLGVTVTGKLHLVLAAVWLVACSNAPMGSPATMSLTSTGAPGPGSTDGGNQDGWAVESDDPDDAEPGATDDDPLADDDAMAGDTGPIESQVLDSTGEPAGEDAKLGDGPAADGKAQDGQVQDAKPFDAKGQDGTAPSDAGETDATVAGDAKPGKDSQIVKDTGGLVDVDEEDDAEGTLPSPDATEPPPDAATNSVCAKKVGSVSVKETVGGAGKVDLVFFVDTSGSMIQEAAWVSQNLNGFANWLQAQNLDVHVILIGKTMSSVKLCINPPLADAACGTKGPNFLQIPDYVGSTDGLSKFLAAYPKFQAFLRPDATKSIIAITDDNSSMPASTFTTALAKLQNPGFGKDWVFHSIVSFLNPNPLASQAAKGCSTGASLGKVYLTLTQQTAGVAFQLCLQDWKPIFDQLAKSVAASAKPVCSYAIPWPDGQKVATAGMKLLHTEPQGLIQPLLPVAGAKDCEATPTGWYADNPASPSEITVCPQTCQSMNGGFMVFDFGCP